VPEDPSMSIADLMIARRDRDPAAPMVELRAEDGGWRPLSAAQAVDSVAALAKGLVAAGIGRGDRVGIMASTSWEWTRLDLALWWIGAAAVPVYETSSAEQVEWIASDSGMRAVVLDKSAHLRLVRRALKAVPAVRDVWVIEEGALGKLERRGVGVADADLDAARAAVTGRDLATVIYTSGTTGRPKGVELTHSNFVHPARNTGVELEFICGEGSRSLQFLPLAHVFARMINVIALAAGTVLGFSPGAANLVEDLQSFKPTFILVVPRVLEKVYNGAEQKTGGGLKLKLFRWAAKVAIVSSREFDSRGGLTPVRRWQHAVCQVLVYRKLQATFGGALTIAVSGGAPLGERLGHFFRGIGLNVYEGYGLTETTAPTAVNRERLNKIGTVGPPLPTMELKIASDGEVLVKGPHVFRAYRNNEAATAEAFDEDGWFRTGDVGSLDADGYLTITGRRKELIVTAAGKNVAPAVLEDRLRGHPLVSQCVVVGDKRPFVAALITLDAEMLQGWLANHGKSALTLEQALIDPDIAQSLRRGVARANQAVSRAESIREYRLLPEDFTEANGYLTPSMKVKRTLVLRDFADEIDALYAEAAARRVKV
jgi:long-chain acyl-CoA synthetase